MPCRRNVSHSSHFRISRNVEHGDSSSSARNAPHRLASGRSACSSANEQWRERTSNRQRQELKRCSALRLESKIHSVVPCSTDHAGDLDLCTTTAG
jgi:hypothetical protein